MKNKTLLCKTRHCYSKQEILKQNSSHGGMQTRYFSDKIDFVIKNKKALCILDIVMQANTL